MTKQQLLIKEIETLPPQVVEEVYHYVCFLKVRKAQETESGNVLLASEKKLAADWLLPEEDIAWANL